MANTTDVLIPINGRTSKDLGIIFDELLENIDFKNQLGISYLSCGVKAKWRDFQFIAGFDIPSDVGEAINFLTPDSVYKRFEILAGNNIIAVSEFAKHKEIDVLDTFFDKRKNPIIYGCNLGTGFVTFNINRLDHTTINFPNPNPNPNPLKELRENLVILTVGELKIVSIHFLGDGPKSMSELVHGHKYTRENGVFTPQEGNTSPPEKFTPQRIIK